MEMKNRLYHMGFQVIQTPDIQAGRKNADFGQGFYLSDDENFSRRWAHERNGFNTYLNVYELDCSELNVKYLERNEEWYDYIFANRSGKQDEFATYDIVVGPIANDTIYDTFGVLTSGLIGKEQALRLLMVGPAYTQIAIKSDKAVRALQFITATQLDSSEIAEYRGVVKEEQDSFQKDFLSLLEEINEDSET